jgi:hypothetical protein
LLGELSFGVYVRLPIGGCIARDLTNRQRESRISGLR